MCLEKGCVCCSVWENHRFRSMCPCCLSLCFSFRPARISCLKSSPTPFWLRSQLTSAPGIEIMLERGDIALLVVVVARGRIGWNNLINGDEIPLPDIEIANQLIPCLKACFPGRKGGVTVLILLAGCAISVDACGTRNAAQIAQRECCLGLTSCAHRAFVQKECKRKGWIDLILDSQVVEGLSPASSW